MNLEYDEDASEIACVLKAGELSTFSWPRRFYYFLPALSLAEKEYWRKYIDRRVTVERFIQSLRPLPDVERFSLIYGAAEDALRELRQDYDSFIDSVYMCGQLLQDWDAELWTDEDMEQEFGAESSDERTIARYQLKEMQEVYENQADAFLRI